MKSKKKLLLLGVGAMGALAMGVGATSTFAWYSVTASANLSVTANKESLTVTKPADIDLDVANVTITISFSRANLTDGKVSGEDGFSKTYKDNIMPAEYGVLNNNAVAYDGNGSNDWHYAYTDGTNLYWDSTTRGSLNKSNYDCYAAFKVVANIPAVSAEAVAQYSSKSGTLTFQVDDTAGSTDKVSFWTQQSSSTAIPAVSSHANTAQTGDNAGKLTLTVSSLSTNAQTIMLGYVIFNVNGTFDNDDSGKTAGVKFAALTNSDFSA